MDPQLARERQRSRELCKLLNDSREDQQEERARIIAELFGYRTDAWIQPPFFCGYGTNIVLGAKVFFNFNCVVLGAGSVVTRDIPADVFAAGNPCRAIRSLQE